MDFDEAVKFIEGSRSRGIKPGLERITDLLGRMGNPQAHLKFLHIAGTNGKGSAGAMLSKILCEANYKTGFYNSPYIKSPVESLLIDGYTVSEDLFADAVGAIKKFEVFMDDKPTEYEILTAAAFECFMREGCVAVVLEACMGGRRDVTNVIAPKNLLAAIILQIGLDHTKYLGDTAEKIAREKAGVIKRGRPIVLYEQADSIMDVVKDEAKKNNSECYVAHLSAADGYNVSLRGPHQKRNAAAAVTAARLLNGCGFNISELDIKNALARVNWPYRTEIKNRNGCRCLFDSAHNPDGVAALAELIKNDYPKTEVVFLAGFLRDKDYVSMLKIIKPLGKTIVCVTPDNPRALHAEELQKVCVELGFFAETEKCSPEALIKAAAIANNKKQNLVCVFGSQYMLQNV
ncbi:MAG: Mur ligase family protein [Defluviitaleaceae bacterium]|nr:Mur ligase family protein [Defluviitaleaceae bacterium]